MTEVDRALACFKQGFSCSQALLSTYCEQYGLDSTTALKLADGFGGGIAGLGGTCGAVTGAIMVIGLKYGRARADDREAKMKTVEVVREFMARFKARRGSTECADLLGCDIDTPEKYLAAREQGVFTTVCPEVVRDAADILEELL